MASVMASVLREPFALLEWFPQRALAVYGGVLLALVPAGAVWAWCDPRDVDGEAVALKPTRFALSIGIYMLTASAMFRYIRPEFRSAFLPSAAVWMMIVGCTVELFCIGLQAARGRRSHFNTSTPRDAAIFAVMGAFAVLFIGALLPLAWEIAWRPDAHADPHMVWAIVAGLLATVVVGGGTGGLMSARSKHAVGREGGRLPLFGWNLSGGDMRAPHFFGIHAMQALPLIAAAANLLSPTRAGSLLVIGALAYGVLTAGLLYQALHGKSVTKL